MPRLGTSQESQVSITRATSRAGNGIETLARVGYAALGIVYLVIGGLALQRALGNGGATTDAQGAFGTILQQPFGRILLGVMAVGLAGYALWRFIQAFSGGVSGLRHETQDRVKAGFLGVIHAGLAIAAARMAFGMGGSQGQGAGQMAGTFMDQPFGQFLVGAAGVAIVGAGIYRIYSAMKGYFMRYMDTHTMSRAQRDMAERSGKIGITAQGVVLGIVGSFLVQAAMTHDPSQARGLSGALNSLLSQPFGQFLLGIMAIGLIAYAVFMFVEARFHRIQSAPEHGT